jgi:hypothetical protein
MSDPQWVTLARAGELLAVEDAGGQTRPLSKRTISLLIQRGDLEARGVSRDRLVSRKSIHAYQRGERGLWRSDENDPTAAHLAAAVSGALRTGRSKPVTPSPTADTGQRTVIQWRKPKRG